jgi:hypothetical protein
MAQCAALSPVPSLPKRIVLCYVSIMLLNIFLLITENFKHQKLLACLHAFAK